ncbi:MAG: hypothetical protein MZW92_46540 [Comamonadaceae bacterium]|nr:hypothetical protein [Comamonadaceae bacterium]
MALMLLPAAGRGRRPVAVRAVQGQGHRAGGRQRAACSPSAARPAPRA